MRGVNRWAILPALMTVGATLFAAAPAQAAPVRAPAKVCPAHPARLAGKHVHVGLTDHDVLTCADLRGAILDGLVLIQFDLRYADLTDASLVDTNLSQADLTGAKLGGAKFEGADLTQATLNDVTAVGTSFKKARLIQATIHAATLTDADLSGADLTQADLTGTDISGATLTGSSFGQATMTGVKKSGTHGHPSSGDGFATPLVFSGFDFPMYVVPAVIGVFVLLGVLLAVRSARRNIRRSYGYATTVSQNRTPVPYRPTVPDVPAWQPSTTTASMEEARNVIEDVGGKRWFDR